MTAFVDAPAGNGSHPAPHSHATLRPLETRPGVYGSAELTPEFLPSPQRQLALKERQLAKAVEHVVTAPAPTMASLAAELGVARATAYRIVGMPAFQSMLREALTGRLAVTVQKAFSVVEHTMETGSPNLRLRAAQFLIERHDKLSAVAMAGPAAGTNATKVAEAMMQLEKIRVRRAVDRAFPQDLPPEVQAIRDRVRVALSLTTGVRAAEDELLDGALECDEPTDASE